MGAWRPNDTPQTTAQAVAQDQWRSPASTWNSGAKAEDALADPDPINIWVKPTADTCYRIAWNASIPVGLLPSTSAQLCVTVKR